MQHLQPNTTLQGGKYRIERVLGQGGFGNTYEGFNTTFEDKVAIKEFFMQGINDRDDATGSITISLEKNLPQFEEQLEKFKKEAHRIRKLDNPHIVKVHDLFEENGTAYYVMDYVDGENLAERLKRTGKPMTEQEVRAILKPANIMLTKEGQVKLIDFGASKQLNAQKGGATTSTAISYTNGYAPREQMEQNYDKFGPWTDIYALGATIYTLLTNMRPPLPTNIDDDMSEDKHLALPLSDDISSDIKDLVLAMLHTNKNQRPQNVEAIMAVLSNSNQKEKEVCDTLSEETIIDPKRNEAKNEQRKDLIDNKKTQIVSLKKDIEIKSETKKQIKTRLLLSLAILFILGCVGLIIFHNSDEDNPKLQELKFQEAKALFKDNKTKDAIQILEGLADNDYVKAKTALGNIYLIQKNVPLESQKGFSYLEEAAKSDTNAIHLLVIIYGGKKCKGEKFSDDIKLKKYAELAIEKKCCLGKAYFELGNVFARQEKYSNAFFNWQKATEYNETSAHRNIGVLYYNGWGSSVNYDKARFHFEIAMKNSPNDPTLLLYYGLMYKYGNGFSKNLSMAKDYLKKSAEKGNEVAQQEYATLEMPN